ncbi:MAG: hypothetical protein KDM63_10000, partial [Verrucomicrobiae bacterium]|nr:hypothetical protein [Verrucomicrobiae bacterium]
GRCGGGVTDPNFSKGRPKPMNGAEIVIALKKKFKVTTDKALAGKLGMTIQGIQNWKNRKQLRPGHIARLAHTATKAGAADFQRSAIRPLVEFFEIECSDSRFGVNYEIFDSRDERGEDRPYHSGLRDELDSSHGVYLFFDSRGQAIYAGKAKRQSLWREMNLAFNRERGTVQTIKRVNHPLKRASYRTSDEKARQITDQQVPLWEIARYFSAYEVADGLIEDVEALLVRSFANDLLNKRMERFTRHRNNGK